MPRASNGRSRAALFLDRDNTLIEDVPYLDDPRGVRLLPGVRRALQLARRTHRLLLFTNQSGIGRGYYDRQAAEAVNRRMIELLRLPPPLFDDTCMAPEKPEEPAVYRKPSPRFILESIARFQLDPPRCWMVGDRLSDLLAGERAGIRSALVTLGRAPKGELADYVQARKTPLFATLLEFVKGALSAPEE